MAMVDVASKSKDEVVEEMKGRLYRSKVALAVILCRM